MVKVNSTVKLHNTDAAGVLFFGEYFKIAHDAYEEFLLAIGLSIADIIGNDNYLLLIVHAEADFKKPQSVGDNLTTEISLDKIGESSFVLLYTIRDSHGEGSATVRTVHVSVDKATGKKISLPPAVRKALARA